MNKTMTAMMKPIPVRTNNRYNLRLEQERVVYEFMENYPNSVSYADVADNCDNIPGIENINKWGRSSYQSRKCGHILRRLEAKGRIVSTLCCGLRYYSIPVEGGAN